MAFVLINVVYCWKKLEKIISW